MMSDDVEVTDAFVDFNLNNASPGELVLETSGELAVPETFTPIGDDRTIYPNDDRETLIVENDYGVFTGYHDGPVHPPANESPRTTTHALETVDGDTLEWVPLFDHTVKNHQNAHENRSVLQVGIDPFRGYRTSWTVRAELAHRVLERYINGPLGTDCVSYWADYHDQTGRGPFSDAGEYDGYVDAEVVMVPQNIYTWCFERAQDVDADAEVYDG